jgi:hypothetical protein
MKYDTTCTTTSTSHQKRNEYQLLDWTFQSSAMQHSRTHVGHENLLRLVEAGP